jgi:DNA mismatch repair protein MSH3
VRIERFPAPLAYAEAFTSLVSFYASGSESGSGSEHTNPADPAVAALAALPRLAVLALAHAAAHLARFTLADALRHARFFAPFAARTHMLLHGNTLANLCARPRAWEGRGG